MSAGERAPLAHSRQVVALLAEVVPSDRYSVGIGGGMGWDGIEVRALPDRAASWYFDWTWAGTDGIGATYRIYRTVDTDTRDDLEPDGAPEAGADPLTVAKWIAGVVAREVAP